MAEDKPDRPYKPKDALSEALKGSLVMGGAGFLASAAQLALAKQNLGASAVVTRAGSAIGLMGTLHMDRASWQRSYHVQRLLEVHLGLHKVCPQI